jgi:hypothetical protein
MFGKTIHPATKVKYLGLTLEEGLTWGTQLNKVMTRTYMAFWICKGTFGKTWGLKLW